MVYISLLQTIILNTIILQTVILQARAFNCRSFSQKDDRCYLSGDDSVTLPDSAQPNEPVSDPHPASIFLSSSSSCVKKVVTASRYVL